jgi:hypothetical protein
LTAVALMAALFLVRGIQHPALNYDVIAYAALAKQARGDGGKAEAYQELAAKVGSTRLALYVSDPYRERMYRDDAFFRANQPLYTIRPLYILLCSAIGALIHNDVTATYVISAVATALAMLLSYVVACAIGLVGNWRLAVPLTWIVAGGLNLASLSTPDAVEALLSLIFVLLSINGPWRQMRTLALMVTAALMVATRTDAVLLVGCLVLLQWLHEPRHRRAAALVLLAAAATYLAVQWTSGNYGYVALLNFVSDHSQLVVPDNVLHLRAYLVMAAAQALLMLGGGFQQSLYLLATALLATAWLRERRARTDPPADRFSQPVLTLAGALGLYLVARFALFPVPFARYVVVAYILAGILIARVLQPTLRASQVRAPA